MIEKKRPEMKAALLREVRTAMHESFDRVVFEFQTNAVPGYRVGYVDKPILDCAAGDRVPITGEGFLLIRIRPANAHSEAGVSTIENLHQTPGLTLIKEVKLICDFEADVEWVLGLAAPNNYRVFELTSPARLVVDIEHRKSGA